jgi:hypothetical protein
VVVARVGPSPAGEEERLGLGFYRAVFAIMIMTIVVVAPVAIVVVMIVAVMPASLVAWMHRFFVAAVVFSVTSESDVG